MSNLSGLPPERASALLAALDGLEDRLTDKTVVCLPDLFIDHIVALPPWADTQRALTAAFLRGGGNLRGGAQRVVAGGNSANTARALARLGVAARFVAYTSAAALRLLEEATADDPLDLTLVRTGGQTSLTVALELGPERLNVMVNDSGSLEGLRPEDLGEGLPGALKSATAVHIGNWAQNRSNGTAFAAEILRLSKEGGATTFLDPSDATGRDNDVLDFHKRVLKTPALDHLLVNDSEVREIARVLLVELEGGAACKAEDIDAQGSAVAKHSLCSVSAHSPRGSKSFRKGKLEAAVAVEPLTPARTTGAGDAWNAGFIAATLANLPARARLELATVVSRLYVASEDPRPPALAQVRQALQGAG